MNRRDLLKQMSLASAALLMPSARVFAAPEDYTGRFFITLQAAGAWERARNNFNILILLGISYS